MMLATQDIGWIAPEAPPLGADFGSRAERLSQAAAAGLPVPPGLVLRGTALIEAEHPDRAADLLAALASQAGASPGRPVALRPAHAGAGALMPAILHLGHGAESDGLAGRLGAWAAADLERRHIEEYGAGVLGLDRDGFEMRLYEALKRLGLDSPTEMSPADLAALAAEHRAEIRAAGAEIPASPGAQLAAAIAASRARWEAAVARRRGQAPHHGPQLLLQIQAIGLGPEPSGAGFLTRRSEATGAVAETGRFLPQAQGGDVLQGLRTPMVMSRAERERGGLVTPALEETAPEIHGRIRALAADLEARLGEAHRIEIAVEGERLALVGLEPARRSARAAVRIAVDLAASGALSRPAALSRVSPAEVEEHLHPSVVPEAGAEILGRGLAASPGAASGPLVFSPEAAEVSAAEGQPAILALIETGPEDIRGMHVAAGVLTVRGGMTSHAALVARGLGKPCVVGARTFALEPGGAGLRAPGGGRFGPGDEITVNGTDGTVLAGRVETRPPEITGAFATLMGWADDARRLAVRANADTAADAATARGFNAAGIGLCRTEHMFFQKGRIAAMREMILAEDAEARHRALAWLAPMQTADFVALFQAMAGLPVVIRLLDPPLHEFLPHGPAEIAEVAERLRVSEDRVRARKLELEEFNPMLGNRGCRIGIAYPEIYEMQARAIFEAAEIAGTETGAAVRPEIMIPLVSAVREFELLRARIDRVAEAAGAGPYTVGVMMETPRACLRAGDIARRADFLSFGTNDLTQMLYGLSRDDAGRFMPTYLEEGVFAHDPFHRIDEEGVGEIIRLAIARARAVKPAISIGLCGEHGGDPVSIAFCEANGFDYVSCSPYRVPVARLAAAQAVAP